MKVVSSMMMMILMMMILMESRRRENVSQLVAQTNRTPPGPREIGTRQERPHPTYTPLAHTDTASTVPGTWRLYRERAGASASSAAINLMQ